MNRKFVFGSFARNQRILRGFGRGPGVAGWPGGAGLWSRWPAGLPSGAPKEAQEALWDSAVGHPNRAPYRCDSLFWQSFGVPWGVQGGGLARCGGPFVCLGALRVLSWFIGPRLASAALGTAVGFLRVPGVRVRSLKRQVNAFVSIMFLSVARSV